MLIGGFDIGAKALDLKIAGVGVGARHEKRMKRTEGGCEEENKRGKGSNDNKANEDALEEK